METIGKAAIGLLMTGVAWFLLDKKVKEAKTRTSVLANEIDKLNTTIEELKRMQANEAEMRDELMQAREFINNLIKTEDPVGPIDDLDKKE